MRTTEIIDNLEFGDSTKKNVNKLNQLIEQVNNNTEHIILADDKTIRKIKLDGEDRLATNMEVLTLDQFQTLVNGQVVTLADGREILFDEECVYYITDDNGDAILNNLYKRIDYGMIRGWANNMVCDETIDPVPTLRYLYAYAPIDGPVNGHPMYTCRITKLSTEFIEVEATDLYTGFNYVTVKKDGSWSEWISSTPEYLCAKSDMTLYVSPDGDDINGDGSQELPFQTFEKAIKEFPPIANGHSYYIGVKPGLYEGFTLNNRTIDLVGYDEGTPGIVAFSSQLRLINGACLIANSDKMLSMNFVIPSNSTAVYIDKNSSFCVHCNVVMSGEEYSDNTTGIVVENGSSCTLYASLIATYITTILKTNTTARLFVDAITATSCDCIGIADKCSTIGYESVKCNDVNREFVGLHGGRIIRGNQVVRSTVVGNNTATEYERKRWYRIATLEITHGAREVKTTFSIRSTYHDLDIYGLLTLDFATNSDMSALEFASGCWDYATDEITESIQVVYSLVNNKLTANIYALIKDAWQTFSVSIESDSRRSQPYPYDDEHWKLHQDYSSSVPVDDELFGFELELTDVVMQLPVASKQFTGNDALDLEKIKAFMIYYKEYPIPDSEFGMLGGIDSNGRHFVRVKITNDRITEDDDIDITITEELKEYIDSKSYTLSGETHNGWFEIFVTGDSIPHPNFSGCYYQIRKPALDL